MAAAAQTSESGLATGTEALFGLLYVQAHVVRVIDDAFDVSPSRVSRLTEELVARGWLERAVSPHDGRLSLVRLTDAGRMTLASMEATFAEAVRANLLDRLTPKQLDSIVAVCRSLGAPHC